MAQRQEVHGAVYGEARGEQRESRHLQQTVAAAPAVEAHVVAGAQVVDAEPLGARDDARQALGPALEKSVRWAQPDRYRAIHARLGTLLARWASSCAASDWKERA
jgi:hypothetical protein